MRMKKLMILAVTALALAACAKTYEVQEVTQSLPVGFSTWTSTLTKAPITEFANNDVFVVYGYKSVGSTHTEVFNGVDVTKGSSGWTYTPLRYYDPASTDYKFFAVFPKNVEGAATTTAVVNTYLGTSTSVDGTTGVITGSNYGLFASNDITFSGSNNDILVAGQKTVTKANYGSIVEMKFNHIASLVDVKAKKDNTLAAATVTVTSIKLVGVDTKGTFTVSGYSTADAADANLLKPTCTWAAASTPIVSTTEYQNTSGVVVTTTTTYDGTNLLPTGTGDPSGQDLLSNLILMPQSLSATTKKVVISYTITDGGITSTTTDLEFPISDFFGTDKKNNDGLTDNITSWLQGTHYTYYITIGANSIKFSASINLWATQNGFHYLMD